MQARIYASSEAFKQALEQRLRAATGNGPDVARRRQLLVFDRFLARVVAVFGSSVILKGGLVLELRLERVRATRDIDLRFVGASERTLESLQSAARLDLGDFLTFEVGPDDAHPVMQHDGMVYEGLRFRAEGRLAGKLYGQRFGIDVAFGDPILGDPDMVVADDVLGFAGIPPPKLLLYPIASHIAEKLHAYTMPRGRPNTRVKDLPDLALLATAAELDCDRLRAALDQTFRHRNTHQVPAMLPSPPASWEGPFAAIAREDRLVWRSLEQVTAAVRAFLDPVLASERLGRWDRDSWAWRRS